MKVLHVTPSYYPATRWGGPIFSTKAICDGIASDPEIELTVLTTDAAGRKIRDRLSVNEREVFLPQGYVVKYVRRRAGHSIAPGMIWHLLREVYAADIIHLTAVYSFPTLPTLLLARLFKKPLVWSPRGALQATAEWKGARNVWLKTRFEGLVQFVRPHRRIVLHTTAPKEAELSVAKLAGLDAVVIPNSVPMPKKSALKRHSNGTIKLLFIGRIHKVKGLERLLSAFEKLPENFTLDIYGEGESPYAKALTSRIGLISDRIVFHGHVDGQRKSAAFYGSDIFILPSYSENFGMSVAEALAHGVPVITTTATPWTNLDREGCGRCIDLASIDLAAAIIDLSRQDLAEMGRRGRAWMEREFSHASATKAFLNLYHRLTADCEA